MRRPLALAAVLAVAAVAPVARAADIPPRRVIADKDPNFNTLWVDVVNDEILVGNDAHESLQVYSRTANGLTAPLREIKGPHTFVTFPGQVVVDPGHDEIWSVGNDIADLVTIYERTADGDIAPKRQLSLRGLRLNRTWGLYVDTVNDEIALSHQRRNAITIWSRLAVTGGEPLRTIVGPDTGIANPHAVFIDPRRDEIYVLNMGHARGTTALPSITVYPRDAKGNTPPLRTIQGRETGLDNCGQMFVDTERGEIYVANGSPSNEILVFDQLADGKARPKRVIRGHRTGLASPSGVFVDTRHGELYVANWGNHTITVYPRDAAGDVAPSRVISPTTSRVSAGIGNPGAMFVDPVHDEIGIVN
jgi:DNA-binding beta-propeller fold protein YncE